MKKRTFILLAILLASCKVDPKPINYGTDACHYCSMTIVDQQHASELVTKKGKVYTFDAMECMLNHLNTIDVEEVELFLTNTYNKPGELTDATKATYVISEAIPSPMGAFLTAFATEMDAEMAQSKNNGKIFSWKEIKKFLKPTQGTGNL